MTNTRTRFVVDDAGKVTDRAEQPGSSGGVEELRHMQARWAKDFNDKNWPRLACLGGLLIILGVALWQTTEASTSYKIGSIVLFIFAALFWVAAGLMAWDAYRKD